MLEKIIQTALMVPMANGSWGLPLILWGNPGIGKSDRVEAGGRSVGLRTTTIYPGTHQPEDVSGVLIPHISLDGKYYPPKKEMLLPINEILRDEVGVIFLDEISNARPAVQGAMLGLILARVIAGEKIPNRVRIIAAGNPPETSAGGWVLTAPMANRFCHIDVDTPKASEWVSWLKGVYDIPAKPFDDAEKAIMEQWDNVYPTNVNIVSSFISSYEKSLYNLPDDDVQRGRSWPSPRTWEFSIRAMTTAQIMGNKSIEKVLVSGCIGKDAASDFFKYRAALDLPNVEEVLEGKWFKTDRLDVLSIVCENTVSHAIGSSSLALVAMAWKFIHKLITSGFADLAVPHAKRLASTINRTTNKSFGLDSFKGTEHEKMLSQVMIDLHETGILKHV